MYVCACKQSAVCVARIQGSCWVRQIIVLLPFLCYLQTREAHRDAGQSPKILPQICQTAISNPANYMILLHFHTFSLSLSTFFLYFLCKCHLRCRCSIDNCTWVYSRPCFCCVLAWTHTILSVLVWTHTILSVLAWTHTILSVLAWNHTILSVLALTHTILPVLAWTHTILLC